MARTDWLVSSRESWADQTITIDASVEVITAPLGGLYLLHVVADLSMIHQLYLALVAAGVAAPTVTITKSRRVRITSSGTFAITWGSGTELRDLLGFDGDLSGAAEYVAESRSTLLWSGGKIGSPRKAPLDATGSPSFDGSVTLGPTGIMTVRQEGDPTVTEIYDWKRTPKARFFASPLTGAVPGDWRHFWQYEQITARKIAVLRKVSEGDDDDDTDADYSASYVLGPYVADLSGRDALTFKMTRSLPTIEKYYDVEWPAIVCAEFSA